MPSDLDTPETAALRQQARDALESNEADDLAPDVYEQLVRASDGRADEAQVRGTLADLKRSTK